MSGYILWWEYLWGGAYFWDGHNFGLDIFLGGHILRVGIFLEWTYFGIGHIFVVGIFWVWANFGGGNILG